MCPQRACVCDAFGTNWPSKSIPIKIARRRHLETANTSKDLVGLPAPTSIGLSAFTSLQFDWSTHDPLTSELDQFE